MASKYRICKTCIVGPCCTHICEAFRKEVLKKHEICISQGDALKEAGMSVKEIIDMIDEHIEIYNKQKPRPAVLEDLSFYKTMTILK